MSFRRLEEDEKGHPLLPNQSLPPLRHLSGRLSGANRHFKYFIVVIVAAMIKAMDVPDEGIRIIAFVCENDAYPAIDAAALNKLRLSPFIALSRCAAGFFQPGVDCGRSVRVSMAS